MQYECENIHIQVLSFYIIKKLYLPWQSWNHQPVAWEFFTLTRLHIIRMYVIHCRFELIALHDIKTFMKKSAEIFNNVP